jgi:hypothetical protein
MVRTEPWSGQSHGHDRAMVGTEPWSGQSYGQGGEETGSHDPNQQTDEDQLHVRVASLRPREPLCQHHRTVRLAPITLFGTPTCLSLRNCRLQVSNAASTGTGSRIAI